MKFPSRFHPAKSSILWGIGSLLLREGEQVFPSPSMGEGRVRVPILFQYFRNNDGRGYQMISQTNSAALDSDIIGILTGFVFRQSRLFDCHSERIIEG
jgi:hypothetical protein